MVSRTILPGGLTIVTEYVPHVRSASIGFWLRAGSRYEADREHGVSHLIEHLLFKGTKTRSARELAETIDAAGGHLNAFTGREMTCYYARVPDQHVHLAIDLLADMLVNPRLDEGDLEKEKAVVLEEIKMYEDTPDDLVHEMFNEGVFAAHPLARSVLGTEESVTSLSRDGIIDYMADHYTADNLVVSVAGHVEHERIVDWLQDHLRDFTAADAAACRRVPAPATAGARVAWREKDIEQVHVCVGRPGFPRGHEQRFAVSLFDTILGGGMSSRLFQELREERGLVYSVYSFHQSFAGAGCFGVYAAAAPEHVREVIEGIAQEFHRIREDGLRPGELARAKEQLKGGLLLSLENTSTRMSRLAKSELFEEPFWSPDDLVASIDRVTEDEVAWVARELCSPSLWTCVAVGPKVEGVFAPFESGLGTAKEGDVA